MMSVTRWVGFGLLVLLTIAASAWLYLRREPPGPARLLLASLRAAALAIVLLLLFDPLLPAGAGGARQRGPHLLLDASASMSLPVSATDSSTRWEAALGEVARRGGSLLLFGDRVRPGDPDSLRSVLPGDGRSQLLPALRAAAEAGAERVTVITDGELEAANSIPAWLARLGLGVEWVRVGEQLGGLSIPDVGAPAWAEAGTPIELRVTVAAQPPAADSATLVVRQAGRTLLRQALAAPPPGRSAEVHLPVQPEAPADGGFVQLEVALEPGDVLAADDRRVVSVFVSAEPTGVTLVSLAPDQEPRFLLPVLARALGVPVLGFLRTATGWVRMGIGQQAGERVAEGAVSRAVGRAELLVVQGPGADQPEWLARALAARAGLLILAPGSGPGLTLPVEVGAPVEGDWFLGSRVPPSPLAPQLADALSADLPPLTALRAARVSPEAWAPLLVTRGRAGEPRPALVAGEAGGRRWAMALGEGYWRWAFQGGDARELYERLWSAVGGWLLAGGVSGGASLRPVERVVARGAGSRWVAPGVHLDSLRLRLVAASGETALDTVLRAPQRDTLEAPVVAPGGYRFTARGYGAQQQLDGEGELTVESWTPELARPAAELSALRPAGRVTDGGSERGLRRPLHALALPYVLLLLLLAAEWILRRRWGLR